jgi:hypothetical protein
VIQELFDCVPEGCVPLLINGWSDGSAYDKGGKRKNEPMVVVLGNIGIDNRFQNARLISNLCLPPKPKDGEGWKDVRVTVMQAHLAGILDRIGMCQQAGGFTMYMPGIGREIRWFPVLGYLFGDFEALEEMSLYKAMMRNLICRTCLYRALHVFRPLVDEALGPQEDWKLQSTSAREARRQAAMRAPRSDAKQRRTRANKHYTYAVASALTPYRFADYYRGSSALNDCIAALVTPRDTLHMWRLGLVRDVIGFFKPMLSGWNGVGLVREGLDSYLIAIGCGNALSAERVEAKGWSACLKGYSLALHLVTSECHDETIFDAYLPSLHRLLHVMNTIEFYLASTSITRVQLIALGDAIVEMTEAVYTYLDLGGETLDEKIKHKRKWHQLCHIIMDIRLYGAPKGYNASPG